MIDNLSIRRLHWRDEERVQKLQMNRDAPNLDLDFFLQDAFERDTAEEDLYDIRDYIGVVGAFKEDDLIAVSTMGYSVDEADEYREVLVDRDDPRILSNLYVIPEYRNKGVARRLVEELVSSTSNTVFLYYLDDRLALFYEKLGFSRPPSVDEFDHNIMLFDKRNGIK